MTFLFFKLSNVKIFLNPEEEEEIRHVKIFLMLSSEEEEEIRHYDISLFQVRRRRRRRRRKPRLLKEP
jgi:hypothetical protein